MLPLLPQNTGPRFLVLGNPENRRVAFFRDAVTRAGHEPPLVISWLDFLREKVALEDVVAPTTILKIESPGESFEVERELVAWGASEGGIDAEAARRLEEDHGRIRHARQWYLGFVAALRRIERALGSAAGGTVLNAPSEIAVMFEKRRCHELFTRHAIPTPRSIGEVRSYEELRARMREADVRRVFVKLAYGSSASGVVALETRTGEVQAQTSVELVREGGVRLYNSLKVRRYRDEGEVAAIVDALAAEGVHVEEWVPKAGIEDHTFDLRIVVLAGEACHTVVRMSRSPMTNLHLGNRRGDPEAVRELVGEERWAEVRRSAERACGLFPRTLCAGVDVLVDSSLRRVFVLEVNAFGDLLPNVLHRGLDTYQAQVAALTGAVAP